MSLSVADRIRGVRRREETIARLGGDGYIAGVTWVADGTQLVAIIDGSGWPEESQSEYYSSRVFGLCGGPGAAEFRGLAGYPTISIFDFLKGGVPYYGFNTLSVDGSLFQYLSTVTRPCTPVDEKILTGSAYWSDSNFNGAKLIYSADHGRTWRNHVGTTPVACEPREGHSHDSLVFFGEPAGAFSILTFLQMGRDYSANEDGYIYVYSPNGIVDGAMNELVMFRVPKDKILQRRAYEFFEVMKEDGKAEWTKDIDRRGVVCTFAPGWVESMWPLAWLPSIIYNEVLGVYMMVNSSGTNSSCKTEKPTYFGVWVAPNPWGPWRQVHEETAWLPGGDNGARAVAPQIVPAWISRDGRSFWLAWSDVQQSSLVETTDPMVSARGREDFMLLRRHWREKHPYFAFNTQKVDLLLE